jgi:hypothetical protein
MGRSNNILGITGNVGSINIASNGIVRQLPASRPVTAARTIENNSEFGRAGKASKLFRTAFSFAVKSASSGNMTSALTAKFKECINADETSVRGQRNVLDGEVELLQGFELNQQVPFSSIVLQAGTPTIVRATGDCTFDLPSIIPVNAILAPQGATHAKIFVTASAMDFEAETSVSATASSASIPLNGTAIDIPALTVNVGANSTKPISLVVHVEFYQTLNGGLYELQNKQFNAGYVAKVDSGV